MLDSPQSLAEKGMGGKKTKGSSKVRPLPLSTLRGAQPHSHWPEHASWVQMATAIPKHCRCVVHSPGDSSVRFRENTQFDLVKLGPGGFTALPATLILGTGTQRCVQLNSEGPKELSFSAEVFKGAGETKKA